VVPSALVKVEGGPRIKSGVTGSKSKQELRKQHELHDYPAGDQRRVLVHCASLLSVFDDRQIASGRWRERWNGR
jgi:hypothetical protein